MDINFGSLQTAGGEWLNLLAAINAAGKYVNLDISACTMEDWGFNHSNYPNKVSGMDKIVEIVLPESLTSIGDNAFYDCTSLTGINLPNGLISIGNGAFVNCGLRNITIPEGITSITDVCGGYTRKAAFEPPFVAR